MDSASNENWSMGNRFVPDQRTHALFPRILLLAILSFLVYVGAPYSIPSGFLVVLLIGYYSRIIILGTPKNRTRSIDSLLLTYTESQVISMVVLAPLSLLGPLILGSLDFATFVTILAWLLALVASFETRHCEALEISEGIGDIRNGPSALAALGLLVGLAVVNLAVSIHIYYNSFDGFLMLFGDTVSNLGVIQGIGTGLASPPNLTIIGNSLLDNPFAITLSLGYNSILLSITRLQSMGELFLILSKVYFHSSVVALLYYFCRMIYARVPIWSFTVASLGIGVVMDVSPLLYFFGTYSPDVPRGMLIPWDLVNQTIRGFYAPSLGYEAALNSFHHIPPVLVLIFIFAILFRIADSWSRLSALCVIATIQLPFYHIGMGFYASAGLALALACYLVYRIAGYRSERSILWIGKAMVIIALAMFLAISGYLTNLFSLSLRQSGIAIFVSLAGYLGLFSILGFLGYLFAHSFPLSHAKWPVILSFDFTLLSLVLWSISRDSGIGFTPMDYFPLFILQTLITLIFILGFAAIESRIANGESDFKKSDKHISGRLGSFTRIKPDRIRSFKLCSVLFLFALSGIQTYWLLNTNLGEFNREFYGTVPMISASGREMLTWIHHNSNNSDVILCHTDHWILAALIGRQIVYPGYRSPDVTDLRYQAYLQMYNSSATSQALGLFIEYDISLIIVSEIEREAFPQGIGKFYNDSTFVQVYGNAGYDVFRFQT